MTYAKNRIDFNNLNCFYNMVLNGYGNLDSYEDVQSLVDNYCTKFDDEVVKYIAETQDNNSDEFEALLVSLNEDEE